MAGSCIGTRPSYALREAVLSSRTINLFYSSKQKSALYVPNATVNNTGFDFYRIQCTPIRYWTVAIQQKPFSKICLRVLTANKKYSTELLHNFFFK